MKNKPRAALPLALASIVLTLAACAQAGAPAEDPKPRPDAAEVKAAYDAVNDSVNALCSRQLSRTVADTTLSYRDGTLRVDVDVTEGQLYIYPVTVVYTLSGFVAADYTVDGVQTAILTDGAWEAEGSFTCRTGNIETLETYMQSDYSAMTGTLIVNGRYSYDYATASYK